jgi:molybdate transport system ATP-binding protein
MSLDGLNPHRLAAIVYDDGRAVDAMMTDFADELRRAGVDARGLVQLPPPPDGCGPRAPMRLRDLETGELIPICQDLGTGATSCALDTTVLADAAMRLRAAASAPCDIVFFSKFGKTEAAGGGFRAELAFAASEGRTVLTAVKRPLLGAYLAFTGDQGTLLDARPWVVRNWWFDRFVRAAAA